MEILFTDPFDDLPAYEREIVRLRAYELTLVLYYKEKIERTILDQIEWHDRWAEKHDSNFQPRAPKGTKKRFKKSIIAMVSGGAISEEEHNEIVEAVDFRNDVGHRIDHLFSDLEQHRFSGGRVDADFRRIAGICEFDHQAVQRMKRVQIILDRTSRTHYNIGTFRWRGHLMFSSTEKTLAALIRNSRKKLQRLSDERHSDIKKLNQDLRHGYQMLNKLREQRYFDIRFDLGKMTARGQEFCYRLFDEGLSDLAIAQIFKMKLRSIQARRRTWRKLGSLNRLKRDWDAIPAIVTPSRYDD